MSKRLLLDSHVFLWSMESPQKIGPNTSELISQADMVFVSAVSAWELGIKARLGKLPLPEPISRGIAKAGFHELRLTVLHAEAAMVVKIPHKDPFDHLLLAIAYAENMPLLTVDTELVGCAGTIDARL